MKFNELPLHTDVIKALDRAHFVKCTYVQQLALPSALEGKDVMVQSKTGSGKTAVFLLTILQKYINEREKGNSSVALVVAPTRELAVQLESDAKIFASELPDYKSGCFYGGVGYELQKKLLSEKVDLIIATPGRILDLQNMGKIDFKSITTFVIDEADRLFDMGFYPDIQKMFKMMVDCTKRQTMLFSATLSTKVRNLAWDHINNPIEIEAEPEEITVNLITQQLYHISKDEKFSLLLRILAAEEASNALLFTNTKAMAIELSKRLNINGYKSQYLMGDLPQNKRLAIINRMKAGNLRFLVATDVAARGLQIDDLELVLNYDLPEDYESYVHRIGRTARAGKSGKAISLACEQFVYGLEAIENFIQMKIPVIWPDEETLPLVEDKSANMRFRDLVSQKEYASRSVKRAPAKRAPSRKGPPVSKKKEATKRIKRTAQQSTSLDKIKGMDFDQRMAYYKKIYHQDESLPKKSSAPKQQKDETLNKVEKPVKQGIFKRLFRKRKSGDA